MIMINKQENAEFFGNRGCGYIVYNQDCAVVVKQL